MESASFAGSGTRLWRPIMNAEAEVEGFFAGTGGAKVERSSEGRSASLFSGDRRGGGLPDVGNNEVKELVAAVRLQGEVDNWSLTVLDWCCTNKQVTQYVACGAGVLDAAIGIEGAYVGHSWEPKRWREEARGVVGQGCRAFAAVSCDGFAVGIRRMRGE